MKTIIAIIVIAILSSCASQKGYNYASHSRKNKSLHSKAMHRNQGRDLTNFRCTNKH